MNDNRIYLGLELLYVFEKISFFGITLSTFWLRSSVSIRGDTFHVLIDFIWYNMQSMVVRKRREKRACRLELRNTISKDKTQ